MSVEWYDQFYREGGWSYDVEFEKRLLEQTIIKPLSLHRDAKILDLGCGMGLHSFLLHDAGFRVTGVDNSAVAIQAAKKCFRGPTYIHCDASNLDQLGAADFDTILVRGMCWYHYELDGINREGIDVVRWTRQLFSCLRPQGIFVLQISTDFSGTEAESGVLNNRYDDYVKLFSPMGDILYTCNWYGIPLINQTQASRTRGNITIATRRVS